MFDLDKWKAESHQRQLDSKPDKYKPTGMVQVSLPLKPVACPWDSPLVICTLATDQAGQELLSVTGDSHRRYAVRCGADYVVIDDKSQAWPLGDKFRIGDVVRKYDRTLYLDSDVIVMDYAPNIFQEYGPESVLMTRVEPWLTNFPWREEYQALCDSQAWKSIATDRYYNSGVWLGSRRHADYWKPPDKPFVGHWTAEEQACRHNAAVSGIPIADMPKIWNWQYYLDQQFEYMEPKPYFFHLAGMSNLPHWRMNLARVLAAMNDGTCRQLPPVAVSFSGRTKSPPVRSLAHRRELGKLFKQRGTGAEVGVLRGENAVDLCEAAQPQTFYLVDRWRLNSESDWRPNPGESWQEIYDAARSKFAECTAAVLVESDSLSWLRSQRANTLDWVYIDANHDRQSVSREITEAARVVRPGGYIAGHDYTLNPIDETGNPYPCGVVEAVTDACNSGVGYLAAVTREAIPSWAMRVF